MPETETKPFEMTLGDGTVVKGATMEEAFQTLAKMKVDTANAYKTEKAEKERLMGEKTMLEGQIQSLQNPPKQVKDGEFDSQKYYNLLNSDPLAANNYWFEASFGMSPGQVTNQFQQIGQQVSTLTQQSVAAAFMAQHADDFPATPEAAKAMRIRTEQLVNSGIPYSLDLLNYTYGNLVQEGEIKPNEPAPAKTEANPSLTGTSGHSNTSTINPETMSDSDLEKYMRSQNWI